MKIMTIIGFALVLMGAVSNFGASKILKLVLGKDKEVTDKHILAMKLTSMVVVVIGIVLVFLCDK